jgi:V/A-type H+-transporting ATPase subunit I
LARLEDEEERARAAVQTYDQPPLFALQAWAPQENVAQLQHYADERHIALNVEEPSPEEQPPTLLRNPPQLASGQDLVTFYMTPSYWIWDPSIVVFFSFVIFFAMIFSDAGYAALLGVGFVFYWRQMGESAVARRLRILFAWLIGATIVYGVCGGSYLGIAPPPDSLLGKLKFLDLSDPALMMPVSIFIGVAHLVLANAMDAWRRGPTATALAPLGWVAMLLGGMALWVGMWADGGWRTVGTWAFGLGFVAVVLFTGEEVSWGRRLVSGVLRLTKIPSAFGDVMSYLRLFALGLATGSLAVAFNDLAKQVYDGVPGLGLLLAILVLLVGHGINFALAIVSGFVHGLRLNFIEFFNWGVPEEGQLFQAFARKEDLTWSRGSTH